jgi:starvation-inducible DNA-binding protein
MPKANMKKPSVTRPSTNTRLTESLNQVLADSYALLSLTHLAHWNVEGPGFFALHTAFQTQYEELFVAIDEIAERIRALDAYAIGGLGTLAKAAQMKEFASPLVQEEYVRALIAANGKLVSDAACARDVAGEAGDAESQDLMIGRITLHQKTIWMLKSFLKPCPAAPLRSPADEHPRSRTLHASRHRADGQLSPSALRRPDRPRRYG